MFFKSYKQFKDSFNKLFKKYHPDNTETGDAELFMKYKEAYDNAIKSGLVDKIINNEEIEITTTQAFNGCVVKCRDFDLKLPAKFYNKHKRIEVIDKKGILHKIYVKIIPEKDEKVSYHIHDKIFADLVVTKIVKINIFDIILGCKKHLNVFGEDYVLELQPYEVLKIKNKEIPNMGYPMRFNIDKRNPLKIQFVVDHIKLSKKDIKIIEDLREKYGKEI